MRRIVSATPTARKRLSTRAFLFSDLRGYTVFVEQRGDAAAAQLLRDYRALVRREVARHDGAEVKTEGDSFYVVFHSPSAALDCAVEILRRADARNAKQPDYELRIGVGLHAGETVSHEHQFVGGAVNVASRIASKAGPGDLLISDTLRGLVRTGSAHPMTDIGLVRLKGVEERIRVWRVSWSPDHLSTSETPHRERSVVPPAVPPITAPAAASLAPPGRVVGQNAAARWAADRRILCPVLIGRSTELDRLTALLAETAAGGGRTALISGEAGVGKTAVLRRFATLARDAGAPVLLGECTEIDARRPFGPFMDIASATNLVAMLPLATRDAVMTAADRYRLHAAFTNLLADLARERPIVIVIEDLHWADEASLELFQHLARRLRDIPLLLVGTYRSDELNRRHPLRPVLTELNRTRVAEDIALRRLSEDEVADFLRESMRLGRPPTLEFRRAIFGTCQGNPLFIEEVLRALVERGEVEYRDGSWRRTKEVAAIAIPDTLRDAVLERFTTLSANAQNVLQHAAVIGQDFDFELLLRVTGLDEATLVSAVRAAIEAQLLLEVESEGSERYAFRHALTRESVLLELLQRERHRMHATVGEAIESRAGQDAAAHAEELAYHFDEAGDRERAFRYHDLAAREAYRLFAFTRAAKHLERAVDLAGDKQPALGELLLRLADAAYLAAMPQRALRVARQAQLWFQDAGDIPRAGFSLTKIARYHWYLGETREARKAADDAARLLEPLGETRLLAGAYAEVARLAYVDLDRATAIEWARRAVDMARQQDAVDIVVDALITLGGADAQLGHVEGVVLQREAIDLASAHDMVDAVMRGLHNRQGALSATGSSGARVRRSYEEMFAYARRHGIRNETVIADEAWYMLDGGDWDAVLRLVQEARGESVYMWSLQICEAALRAGREGPEQSPPLIEAARRQLRNASASHRLSGAGFMARATLLAGDVQAILDDLDRVAADIPTSHYVETDSAVVFAIRASIELENIEARDRWIEIALAGETRPRRIAARARRAFAQAERAASAGDLDASIRLLGESTDLFSESFLPFAETVVRLRRAEILLTRDAAGDRVAAQDQLVAILPYWRKAKATWYLGQLERWAADHGLALPHGGSAGDSVAGA